MIDLTFATINLRNRADRWRERRHLLVAQLLDANADLISLQEVSFPIGQGTWLKNQLNVRLSGNSERPYQLIQKRKHDLIKGYHEGIGILAKLPVLYHDYVVLGYGGRVALRANIELPNRQTLDFVSVHLHHTADGMQARQEQAMKMVGWLESKRRVPWQVVAGDFNEVPDGLAIQVLKQAYRSAYEQANGREPYATFPTALATGVDWSACLDYIFLSPALAQHPLHQVRLFCNRPADNDETLYPSDHVGILARMTL